MTRSMADATSVNYPSLPAGLLWAGYVTGTPDVQWTAAQLASAAVTIDQGGPGSPVASAIVRDVEAEAWTVGAAVDLTGWTTPRPTIYISLDSLPALAQAGWRGDVWVADYTGAPPASPPSMPAGMTCVAVQYTDQGGGGTYDLSVIFDPTWPQRGQMAFLVQDATTGATYLIDGGKSHYVATTAAVQAYQSIGIQYISGMADSEVQALIEDFPPGQPTVAVGSITFPTYTSTPEAPS